MAAECVQTGPRFGHQRIWQNLAISTSELRAAQRLHNDRPLSNEQIPGALHVKASSVNLFCEAVKTIEMTSNYFQQCIFPRRVTIAVQIEVGQRRLIATGVYNSRSWLMIPQQTKGMMIPMGETESNAKEKSERQRTFHLKAEPTEKRGQVMFQWTQGLHEQQTLCLSTEQYKHATWCWRRCN